MEKQEEEKIMAFYTACNELGSCKLILADAKIGKILKLLMSSSELFSIVGQCLVNFDFEKEFEKAQRKDALKNLYFSLPNDRKKVVALVFSILSACDTNKLDLHSFVRNFFANDSGDMTYGFLNFVKKIVYPFRDNLCSMIVVDDEQESTEKGEKECDICQEEPEFDEDDILGNFFSQVSTILSKIKETIKEDAKVKPARKDEIFITIEALLISADLGNLKIMNALVISLYYLLDSIKSVRFYKNELEELFADFYSNLK